MPQLRCFVLGRDYHNVPGTNGKSNAANRDSVGFLSLRNTLKKTPMLIACPQQPLVAQMPASVACTHEFDKPKRENRGSRLAFSVDARA